MGRDAELSNRNNHMHPTMVGAFILPSWIGFLDSRLFAITRQSRSHLEALIAIAECQMESQRDHRIGARARFKRAHDGWSMNTMATDSVQSDLATRCHLDALGRRRFGPRPHFGRHKDCIVFSRRHGHR